MSVVGEATVVVKADASKFAPEAGKQIEQGLDPLVKRIGSVLAGAFVGKKILGGFKDGLDELKESAAVVAQTEAAIKSTGGAAQVTTDQIGDLATAQSELTGIDDELIQKGSNLLLTFTQIKNQVGEGNDIFNQATIAAEDLSTAGFGSLESASVLLGKALNDPVAGLTALQRVGVRLSDTQKETVKQLVATGDTLGAQKVILKEVETQVGGSAAAFGETLPGQLAKAKNASDEMKAALVGGMAPALVSISGFVTAAATDIAGLPEPLRIAAGGALAFGAAFFTVARPIKEGLEILRLLRPAHAAAATAAKAQAIAETELAGAETLSTGAGGKLAAVLGTAGIVAGAAAAVGALYLYGQSLNDTTASTEDVLKVTKLTGDQTAAMLDRLASISTGAFSGEFKSYIDGLAGAGEAGIGVLRTYRQHLVDTHQSTELVDQALASAAESQANLNANQEAGADPTEAQIKMYDAAAKAAENYGGFINALGDAMVKQYDDSTAALHGAIDYEDAIDKLITTVQKSSDVVYESASTLDIHTEKGRENLNQVLATGDAIAKLIQQRFDDTQSVDDAVAAGKYYVANLGDQLHAAGLNDDQIAQMIDTMNLTPEKIETSFSSNAAEQQIVVGKYLQTLKDIPDDQRTIIETLINEGRYAEANARLNDLTRDRNVDIYITQHGTVNIPDLGPDANREFHGAGNASGTDYWRGGPTLVGEIGPEVVDLPRGTRIRSNADLVAAGGVRSGDVYQVDVDARGAHDPWAVGRAVADGIAERKWRFPERGM